MRHTPFALCALAALALGGAQSGQGNPVSRPPDTLEITLGPDPAGRPFAFHFSQPVPFERCSVYTYQTGDFGGLGLPAFPPFGGRMGTVYTMRTGNNGKPARTLKAAVWCPGFASEAVHIPDVPAAPAEAPIALKPLRNVTMTGTILPSEDGVSFSGATLAVWYGALWWSAFIGQSDGFTHQFQVAETQIGGDGSFRVDVPDFMNDPTVARFRYPGGFRFAASRSTPPHDYRLETDSGRNLPVAAKYTPVRLQPRR